MGMSKVYQLQKLNRSIKSHRPKFAGVLMLNLLRARHLFLRFDPVIACNLSCQMCFFSDRNYRKNNKGIFTPEEIDRLAEMFFPLTRQVVFGCAAEPTLYKDYPDLVRIAKSYGVPHVGMVSNGQLFTEDSIRQMVVNGLDEMMLSLHGVHKDSYESMMTGAKYEKFHFVLETLGKIKKELGVSDPELRINYTVNSDNLTELRDFFDVYGGYDITTLQIRPIMDIGQSVYRNFDLDKFVDEYNEIIDLLQAQCNERGITFLARKENPAYKGGAVPIIADAAKVAAATMQATSTEDAMARTPRPAPISAAGATSLHPNNPAPISAGKPVVARAPKPAAKANKSAPVPANDPVMARESTPAPVAAEKPELAKDSTPAPRPLDAPAPDPEMDYGSLALDSVLRFVSPQRVWRPDFDWRNETYDAFCKRTGFRRSLFNAVFTGPEDLLRNNPFRSTLTLSYDVL